MALLSRERVVSVCVVVVLLAIIVFMGKWILSKNSIMIVPKGSVDNVRVCIKNEVSCSLLYESKDEVPESVLK